MDSSGEKNTGNMEHAEEKKRETTNPASEASTLAELRTALGTGRLIQHHLIEEDKPITNPVFLYVEDDPFSREAMQMLLISMQGYEKLTIFENSREFAPRVQALSEPANVILLDIHMEPLDGYEMSKLLRMMPGYENARIIAITADVTTVNVHTLKKAGFDGLIYKPIDPESFPDKLQSILNGKKVWETPA